MSAEVISITRRNGDDLPPVFERLEVVLGARKMELHEVPFYKLPSGDLQGAEGVPYRRVFIASRADDALAVFSHHLSPTLFGNVLPTLGEANFSSLRSGRRTIRTVLADRDHVDVFYFEEKMGILMPAAKLLERAQNAY